MASPGDQFRRLRVERGFDLVEASRRAGISEARLAALESGSVAAWFEEAVRLARAYGMTVDELAAEVNGWKRR